MDNILLQKAIEYAQRGWYVFPCREKDSKPFINKKGKEVIIPMKAPYLKGGFKSCTTDINFIKQGKTEEEAIKSASNYAGWNKHWINNRWSRKIGLYDLQKDRTTKYKFPYVS